MEIKRMRYIWGSLANDVQNIIHSKHPVALAVVVILRELFLMFLASSAAFYWFYFL